MGLPIWREPEGQTSTKAASKAEPSNAHDRVNSGRIRRREQARRRAEQFHERHPRSLYPPLLDEHIEREISQSTQHTSNNLHPQLLDLPRPGRHTAEDYAGVPPISTLLDAAAGRAPPPVPESRNYFLAERQSSEDNNTSSRRTRSGTAAVDRARLIEETNRIVSSLREQATLDEPVPDTSQGEESYSPVIPALRRERSLRGTENAVRSAGARIDGLGDRNRSPTPPEAWEVMRSTIQPDTTLPSAESSFTSAAASQSFSGGSVSTTITDPEDVSSPDGPVDDESTSSLDLDICADDENLGATEALARDMYYREMESPEGRERIAQQEALRASEGNRFAMATEAASVDIGFRLIEAALERVEDRHRTLRLRGQSRNTAAFGPDLARLSDIIEDDRARQSRRISRGQEPETSLEAPEAHPVGLISTRDAEESFTPTLDSEQDLDSMRRVVEVLASREDVPEEWWMSMGLNFSRARPRRNREAQSVVRDSRVEADMARVRNGRVQRARDDRDRASRL